ncbi:bifunctional methylenetetrahydrofolate dehydrogenase/methenyltetrahydrofolate cyclohydrolase FolD [Clostridium sp. 'deep sea']|uniref:bifunctional methylenetetrahydrofolate dehydrogenase/methenyltetrahydrofolate cyclohydrolase FolD n=1 Tax=Clostridium sp. 'deep sea' TaxID=2779445 RepID=UPI001A9B201C|nr:bifunctional methylenetetrahydrofolate dehydrogenase/methenyltetrahydrofolate cyclohydrolase FolD [Clostridium sp. 'deep sea']
MMATLIDGKGIAKTIENELKQQVVELKEQGIMPGLAVVLVGEDPASKTYVRSKERACKRIGIYSKKVKYDTDITQEELLKTIYELNNDDSIHGILVQLPLPAHIDSEAVINAIDYKKDVDGFHPINIGKMFLNEDSYWSCTPHGVIELLDRSNIEIAGKDAVIVGASNIVGKPMATMLLNREATATVCHIKTKDLAFHTKQADILVVAVGKPNLITADMVKDGVAVIDVGINRLDDGRLVGDVDFEAVSKKASAITPVPGGVGPMTIIMLMKNTIKSAINHAKA